MPKFYVATGEIREVVKAENPKEAAVAALVQVSTRSTEAGELIGAPGKFIATSRTGFFADDAVWDLFDTARKKAGIVFSDETEAAVAAESP